MAKAANSPSRSIDSALDALVTEAPDLDRKRCQPCQLAAAEEDEPEPAPPLSARRKSLVWCG